MSPTLPVVALPVLPLPFALGAGPPTAGELAGVVVLAFAATATVSRAVLLADRAVGSRLERAVARVRPADRLRLLAGFVAMAAVAFAAAFVAVGWV